MSLWANLFGKDVLQYKQPEKEMTETERKLELLLGDVLAENERLRRELKYQYAQENHTGTHSPECWSYGPRHYECAIRHINAITKND